MTVVNKATTWPYPDNDLSQWWWPTITTSWNWGFSTGRRQPSCWLCDGHHLSCALESTFFNALLLSSGLCL